MFSTDGPLRQYASPGTGWQQYADIMKANLPGEYAAFAASRQSTGRLGLRILFSAMTASVAISVALLAALLFASAFRRGAFRGTPFGGDSRLQALLWLVLATVIANAAICGALSGPSGRYQSRVVWLLPFMLLVVALPPIGAWIARRCQGAPP
jgi:hypothetical protein